ncbi:O-antigen ligase family protein [Lutispora sp.]|uniref:O-antigen ligase family protein n=1 Tax=Lutispora sp. TaxID=2828727 RepID=UPI0035631C0F
MAKKSYINTGSNDKTINGFFMFLIASFMIIIPFYRGLFFRVNYIPAIIFISMLFAVSMAHKLRRKDYKILDTYTDITVFLIPASYLISFFFAANTKDAFDMFLLYCSYFMLYKLTSDLSVGDKKYKDVFIDVIIASAFLLSFTAIMNMTGFIDINGAFIGKRLYGLYQYANSTASVLGVGIILALNKLISEENIKRAAIYQSVMTALIASFIFTLSRGGYLVLAGVLLLNFILINAKAKLRLLMGLFVSLISSFMLIFKFYTLAEENISAIWIHYLVSIILSAIIVCIIYSFKSKVKLDFPDKTINISLVIMVTAFTVIAILLFSIKEPIEYKIVHRASEESSWKDRNISMFDLEPDEEYILEFDVKASLETPNSYGVVARSYNNENKQSEILRHFEPTGPQFTKKSFNFTTLENTEKVTIYLYNYDSGSNTVYRNVTIRDSNGIILRKMERPKYLPAAIADRLTDINMESESISSRIYFTTDGLKIMKDYTITGAGGGAWKNLYRQYQSVPYNTTEVHNFYVQYGIEVGIIGLAALTGLLLLLIASMIKSIKARSNYLCVYLAVMLLLLHSTIDFNLSLAAVGYILWMLIGIANSEKNSPAIKREQNTHIKVLSLALTLIILFTSSSIYYGMKLGNQGARASRNKEGSNRVMELYQKASVFDRFNGAYRIDLAQMMNNELRKTKDKKYLDGIEEQISLIKRYEPYNHQYTPVICNLHLSLGKFEEASDIVNEKLQHEPMVEQSYMLKIDLNYKVASYYIKDEKVQEAIPYLQKILEASDELEKVNMNLKTPLKLTGNYPKMIEAAQRTLDMAETDQNK